MSPSGETDTTSTDEAIDTLQELALDAEWFRSSCVMLSEMHALALAKNQELTQQLAEAMAKIAELEAR